MSRNEFISYLQTTLIPDLRESGRDATADDFVTCIRFLDDDFKSLNAARNALRQHKQNLSAQAALRLVEKSLKS